MGAKPARRNTKTPQPASVAEPSVVIGRETTAVASESPESWLESTDPRKRMLGKILRVVLWLYVAALWLLALDQIFHWGIFGPALS